MHIIDHILIPTAHAQNGNVPPILRKYVGNIVDTLVNPAITLLFAVALILFLYGMVEFFLTQGAKREDGRRHMIWGVVGMVIMTGVFTILRIVAGTVGAPNPF